MPLFPSQDPTASAQLPALGEWLAANIVDEAQGVEAMASSPTHSSKWGPLAPAGVVQGEAHLKLPCGCPVRHQTESLRC